MKNVIINSLLGLVLLSGCSSVENETKYRRLLGTVDDSKNSYHRLAYEVSFHRNHTIIQLNGYGEEFSKTPMRVYAMDNDNDGDFDVKDVDNVEFNSGDLWKIVEGARNRKY